MSECTTRLTEAREALHSLKLGQQVVSVRRGDRTIEYSPTTAGELEAYVRQLEAQCGGPGGSPLASARRRPMRVTY